MLHQLAHLLLHNFCADNQMTEWYSKCETMEFWEQYLKKILRRRHTVLKIASKFSLHLHYILSIAWNICTFILQNREIMGTDV